MILRRPALRGLTLPKGGSGGPIVEPLQLGGAPAAGRVGQPYAFQLVISGGQPPYSVTILNGIPLDGLAFDTSTALLSGIPSRDGTMALTFGVTDAVGTSASLIVSIPVYRSAVDLALSAATFFVGDAPGTIIGTLLNTSGGALSLVDDAGGAVALVGGSLRIGPTPPGAAATLAVRVAEDFGGVVHETVLTVKALAAGASVSNAFMVFDGSQGDAAGSVLGTVIYEYAVSSGNVSMTFDGNQSDPAGTVLGTYTT